MNTWDKSTLDEMLFNYFEGTLSPDENSRLFLYLKQHPESYSEFESWSQTYSMRNVPLDDYEISAKLIKPDRSNRRWYFFMAFSILFVTAISIPFLNKEKPVSTTKTIAPKVVVTERNIVQTNPTKEFDSERKLVGKPDLKPALYSSSNLPVLETATEQKRTQTGIDSIIAGEKLTVLEEPKEETDNNVVDVASTEVDIEPVPSGETKRDAVTTKARPTVTPPVKTATKGVRGKLKVDFKGGKEILKTNENF
jgi:hypothetical protein